MGSRYLTDLAAVVRSTGLVVQEEPGWQTRARSSGGYSSGLPNHVMIHHTASGPSSDGQPDVSYMCYSADARPVANLYLNRAGKVWVMAAGATNTNGSGQDPCGAISPDSMNSSAIGIEAGNDGTGEPWPTAQQDAYLTLTGALCTHYGIPIGRVHSHAEWAPGRKIDPAGPSSWAVSGTWDEDAFRADVSGGPTPPPERKKVRMYGIYEAHEDGSCWASDMMTCRWIRTTRGIEHYTSMLQAYGFNPQPQRVPLQEIRDGVYGTPIDQTTWGGYGEGERVWAQMLGPSYGVGPASAGTYVTDTRVVVGDIINAVAPGARTVLTDAED